MRWIKKMNDTVYDGHDELYHRANFGEDRTMHAVCRCENVVFVFCHVFSIFFRSYIVLISVAKWRHNFCEIAVNNCEN